MNKPEVYQEVTKIIVEKKRISPEKVTLDASLVGDLGLDSLDNIETIMEVEDLFGIEIQDNMAEQIKTVRNLVDTAFMLHAIKPAADTPATDKMTHSELVEQLKWIYEQGVAEGKGEGPVVFSFQEIAKAIEDGLSEIANK